MGRAARINQIELEHRAHSRGDARARSRSRTLNGPFLSDEKQQIATVDVSVVVAVRLVVDYMPQSSRVYSLRTVYRLNR